MCACQEVFRKKCLDVLGHDGSGGNCIQWLTRTGKSETLRSSLLHVMVQIPRSRQYVAISTKAGSPAAKNVGSFTTASTVTRVRPGSAAGRRSLDEIQSTGVIRAVISDANECDLSTSETRSSDIKRR